jgi:NAD(P)-dependent dehydrogenase (short-subunit alcohol dehydrogenase family)
MQKNIFDVNDKVIIVTGGMGQLGRQFTKSLCEAGAKVAVFDVKIEKKLFEQYFGKYVQSDRVMDLVVDITRRSSIEAGLRQVVQ